jgi:hypothetical protein
MKKIVSHIFPKLILTACFLAITSLLTFGQVTESRQLTKGFKVNNNSIVDIGNKYGDINIEKCDCDSDKVEIFRC